MVARIRSVLEGVIPEEQAGSRKDSNCCDHVLARTLFIELGFQKNLKTEVVFLDLSAAYDAVWKRWLKMKLSINISCRRTLTLFMNDSDRSFKVETNGKLSRNRTLNNVLLQGSVLSCFLYCTYTSDLPKLFSRWFIYAYDIAIAYSDLQILSKYLKKGFFD